MATASRISCILSYLSLVHGRPMGNSFGATFGSTATAGLNGEGLGSITGSLSGGLNGLLGDFAQHMAASQNDRGTCPPGLIQVPKRLAALPPNFFQCNGCGPQGMALDEPFGLWVCCNRHDVCYSSCGTTFAFCEEEFKGCMNSVCEAGHLPDVEEGDRTKSKCKDTAEGFLALTAMLGKGFHDKSQEVGCDCLGEEEKEAATERYELFLSDLYQHSQGVEKKAADEIRQTVAEHHGREGVAVYKTVQEVGAPLVLKTGRVPVDFSIETVTKDNGTPAETPNQEL
eukprot:TRINITY_DN37428_c0_g1_i1.p1 TRINITY_DN37428_c0_g1~~TRINITY_DN37428_c0_g1_i1.p1  ORF type:complete len:301 (-),score=46.06 TRINITY_DN37428_c0_g1_i1:331-1185(-)